MARPQRKRFVCCIPKNDGFLPKNSEECEEVSLTIDEYETIRLIDLERYTQEECAKHMHISRTTVQEIYNEARKKIADTLVNTKKLLISGGNYTLCKSHTKECDSGDHKECNKYEKVCKKGKNK